jgi:ABC-2 type transport system permease protein
MTLLSSSLVYKPFAFLKRDTIEETSYRLSFLYRFVGILFSAIMFYFIARLLGTSASPYLSEYGGEYFPFVLIGIAFYRYLGVSLSTFAGTIRDGQVTGTLESMLVTPTRITSVLVYSSLWGYLYATYEVLLYLLLGVILFGVHMGAANLFSVLVVLVLTILSFSSFGILSAAFVLVYKRGDPINYLFGTLSSLLGGVYYPISVLPGFLQSCSALLPVTYALRAMRHALLQGMSVGQLGFDLAILSLFAILGLPVSLWIFQRALHRAKAEGTLLQF